MKTICIILSIFLMCLFTSCEKDRWQHYPLKSANQIEACGTNDPLNKLIWLRDLILNSIGTHDFISIVWVKEYNQEDIFIVDGGVSSVAYYVFNCDGVRIYPSDFSIYNGLTGMPNDRYLLYKSDILP